MMRISDADSMEELESVVVDIECDKFEREPWTLDQVQIGRLRNWYMKRKRELS